jgi:hypothetical protein
VEDRLKAVELIRHGQFGWMVANHPPDIVPVPIGEVVGRTKMVPLDSDLLLTAEGPLTKYAFSTRTSPILALTPSPAPTSTTQTTPASGTLVPEQSPAITILDTPTDDPYSYHPLRVTPMAGDTVEYRTFTFRYRTDDYTLKVPVNTSIYQAANTSKNKQMIIDDKEFRLFYQQMVADPAMEPFYKDILEGIQKLRYKGGKTLTDDEYLEMVVSFVQQIPNDNTTPGVRYPIEVVYDQKGDSDEKSILLTGLLSRDAFEVPRAARTDAAGAFAFDGVAAGKRWKAVARGDGFGEGESAAVLVERGTDKGDLASIMRRSPPDADDHGRGPDE